MQNRRSWEGGIPIRTGRCVSTQSGPSDPLLKLVGTNAEQIILPSNRATAAASSLQTVYDLAAKSRVGLRFNCKNLTSKCASLRFTCNRHRSPALPLEATLKGPILASHKRGWTITLRGMQ